MSESTETMVFVSVIECDKEGCGAKAKVEKDARYMTGHVFSVPPAGWQFISIADRYKQVTKAKHYCPNHLLPMKHPAQQGEADGS